MDNSEGGGVAEVAHTPAPNEELTAGSNIERHGDQFNADLEREQTAPVLRGEHAIDDSNPSVVVTDAAEQSGPDAPHTMPGQAASSRASTEVGQAPQPFLMNAGMAVFPSPQAAANRQRSGTLESTQTSRFNQHRGDPSPTASDNPSLDGRHITDIPMTALDAGGSTHAGSTGQHSASGSPSEQQSRSALRYTPAAVMAAASQSGQPVVQPPELPPHGFSLPGSDLEGQTAEPRPSGALDRLSTIATSMTATGAQTTIGQAAGAVARTMPSLETVQNFTNDFVARNQGILTLIGLANSSATPLAAAGALGGWISPKTEAKPPKIAE